MKRLVTLCALTLSASVSTAVEVARTDDPGYTMEEVLVSATYRDTKLMNTPVTISAVTAEMLKDVGAQSMEELFTMIPGLSMAGGGNGEARYTIRGVSSQSGAVGASPVLGTVGVYIDGTPVTSALGPDNQVSGTLFDIERVEVLKGPQGTLFGDGSQGGTIRYIYNKPDVSGFDSAINLSYATMEESDDKSTRADAMVNVPLGDNVALRVTGWTSETAGFIDNLTPFERDFNTSKSTGARAALRVEGDGWFATGSLHHSSQETGGGVDTFQAYQTMSARLPGLEPKAEDQVDIYSLTIEKDFGWATLTSLTSFTDRKVDATTEGSYSGAAQLDLYYFGATAAGDHPECAVAAQIAEATNTEPLCPDWPGLFNLAGPVFPADGRNILALSNVSDFTTEQWVQEFRLVSSADQRLRWTAGAFWKDSEDHTGANSFAGYFPGREAAALAFDPLLTGNIANNHDDFLETKALFGEISYDLTETLEATVGVRVSDIEQHFQRSEIRTSDTPVSPKVVLSWQARNELLIYGGYTNGFRPGNINNHLEFYAGSYDELGLDDEAAQIRSGLFFDGDELDSYELGVKTTLLDGRISLQGAAYFLDWKDMIVSEANPLIVGAADIYNNNSGGAEIKGFELEVNAFVTDRFHVRVAGDSNDTQVTSASEFSTSTEGTELIYAPKSSLTIAMDYSLPLANGWTLDFYLDRAWVAKQYTDAQNAIELPKFERSNGRVTLRSADEKWRVALYGTNLDNDEILRGRTLDGTLWWHNPRQIGLELGYQM